MAHKVEVNDEGIQLAYIDSGPPEGMESYRTLIAIHGYGWSSDVFHKALPEARKQGIRFIALNRRTFPGSTPYTDEELIDLRSKEVDIPKFLTFLRNRGFELIGFVHHIVEQLALPTHAVDGTGSISLLGWSLGNTYVFTVMSCFNDPELPSPWKKTVKDTISSVILFDPPNESCGIRPTEMYSSWPEKLFMENDGPANPIKGAKAVNDWVSGWFRYDHTAEKITKEAFIASNDHPIRPSTAESAPDAGKLLQGSYPPSFESENLIMAGLTLGAYRVIALNVLDSKSRRKRKKSGTGFSGDSTSFFDQNDGEEDMISTKKLGWLWCENSTWCCTYSPHMHRKEFGFDGSDPMRKMVAIPNANHFIHWEEPERFIQYVLPLM